MSRFGATVRRAISNAQREKRVPFFGIAALLGAMSSLAFGTSLAKRIFTDVGAEGTTAIRVGVAAMLMVAVWRPWRWPLSKAHARGVLLYGIALGTMNLLFYASIKTIAFGIAVAIEFLGPLVVAVLSSRRALDFLWIALAMIGLALLVPMHAHDAALDTQGVLFALGAATCWALYIVFGHRIADMHAGQSTSLGMSVAALVAVPVGVAQASSRLLSPRVLLIGIGVAVLSSAIPYSLEMLAFKRLHKRTFSIVLSLEPALAALAGLAFLGESLNPMQWLAIGSVIAASVGSATFSRS